MIIVVGLAWTRNRDLFLTRETAWFSPCAVASGKPAWISRFLVSIRRRSYDGYRRVSSRLVSALVSSCEARGTWSGPGGTPPSYLLRRFFLSSPKKIGRAHV